MVEVNEIKHNGTTLWKKPVLIATPFRVYEANLGTRTVTLTKNGNAPEINLEYSFDNSTWQTWTADSSGNRTMALPENTPLYIRGDNQNGLATSGDNFHSFSCDKEYAIEGDVRSLVSHYEADRLPDFCFTGLFKNSTTLTATDYSRIESTNLGRYCCSQMFYGCTGLLRAPHSLPASVVSERAYDSMFYGCTSLEVMPIIGGTTFSANSCYNMFYGCSSLTQQWTSTSPDVNTRGNIGFTIAASDKYSFSGMFQNCSTLANVSGIVATQTAGWREGVFKNTFNGCSALEYAPSITFSSFENEISACQQMFQNCTSLVSASSIHLDAETLYTSTYKMMFQGCTSFTTAPEIKATSLTYGGSQNVNNGSLAFMFYNCSALNYIKVYFTSWNNGDYTHNWTYGTPASGTFYKLSALAETKNASGNGQNSNYIPYNWTVTNI